MSASLLPRLSINGVGEPGIDSHVISRHDAFVLASSPGPTQKLGKRPGVTCKLSRMLGLST